LNALCNVRTWILCISLTLLFMPLFAKTYRLSKIFDGVIMKKDITDNKLFILVLINLLIDVIILTVLTIWKPLSRYNVYGDPVRVDDLQSVQDVYHVCAFEPDHYFGTYYFIVYGIIAFWKLIQAGWGMHVCLNVTKINMGNGKTIFSKLWQMEETGVQFFSLLFTFVCIIFASPIFVIGILNEQITVHYVVMVVTILLIVNAIMFLNILPRIFAVLCCSKTRKFKRSPSEQVKEAVKNELERLGWNHEAIQRASITSNQSNDNDKPKCKSKFKYNKQSTSKSNDLCASPFDDYRYDGVTTMTMNMSTTYSTTIPTTTDGPSSRHSNTILEIGDEKEIMHLFLEQDDIDEEDDETEERRTSIESVRDLANGKVLMIVTEDNNDNAVEIEMTTDGKNPDEEMEKMWDEQNEKK